MRTSVLGGKEVPVVLPLELVRRASVLQRQERLDVIAEQLRQPRAGGSIELVWYECGWVRHGGQDGGVYL